MGLISKHIFLIPGIYHALSMSKRYFSLILTYLILLIIQDVTQLLLPPWILPYSSKTIFEILSRCWQTFLLGLDSNLWTHRIPCNSAVAAIPNTLKNDHGLVPIKLYSWTLTFKMGGVLASWARDQCKLLRQSCT